MQCCPYSCELGVILGDNDPPPCCTHLNDAVYVSSHAAPVVILPCPLLLFPVLLVPHCPIAAVSQLPLFSQGNPKWFQPSE